MVKAARSSKASKKSKGKPSTGAAKKQTAKPSTGGFGKFKEFFDPLIVISATIGLLAIGLALTYYLAPKNNKNGNVCTTPECTLVASNLLKNMDPEVEACDDFYMAACGRFTESFLHSNQESYSSASRAQKLSGYEMRNIMRSNTSKSEAEKQAKMLFNKCVKDKYNTVDLFNEVKKLRGFPAGSEAWTEADFDMTETILAMSKVIPENMGIFQFNAYEANKTMILLIGMAPAMTSKNDRKSVQNTLETLLLTIATNNSIALSSRWMTDISNALDFDEKIDSYKLSITGGTETLPKIEFFNMEKFVANVISEETRKAENVKGEFKFWTPINGYFEVFLNDLLRNTEKRTIQNYLVFRFLLEMAEYLTPGETVTDREGLCIDKLKKLIPGTIAMAHAHRKIKVENVETAEKMVEDLRETFLERFEKSDWIDDKSKKKAMKKVKEMESYVGYPKHFVEKEEEYVKKLFKKFNIKSSDTFFVSAVKVLNSYSRDLFLSNLKKDRMEFGYKVFVWNAAYHNPTNSLRVSTLPLQTPFFDASLPEYINLGSIGVLVGHEIGHAFDVKNSIDIWSSKTVKAYMKKAECLVDQFDKFELHGKKMNGSLTADENIADSFGLKTAYETMRRNLADQSESEIQRLPGLQNFTPEQLFFYSFASWLCGLPIGLEDVESAFSDVHAPHIFRVLGSVSNSEEFAKAFNCKPKSPMNPKKKCNMF